MVSFLSAWYLYFMHAVILLDKKIVLRWLVYGTFIKKRQAGMAILCSIQLHRLQGFTLLSLIHSSRFPFAYALWILGGGGFWWKFVHIVVAEKPSGCRSGSNTDSLGTAISNNFPLQISVDVWEWSNGEIIIGRVKSKSLDGNRSL